MDIQRYKFLLIAVLSSFVNSFGICDCPSHWLRLGSSCYSLVETTATWAHAVEICQENGSYLAQINNRAQNLFVDIIASGKNSSADRIWIGGHDLLLEGYWMWEMSNDHMEYTEWCPGEPDGHDKGQDCVAVSTSKSDNCAWKWTDENCEEKHHFLCEQSAQTDPIVG